MDSGWRRNKYGGLFNLDDYMNNVIRNKGTKNTFVDKDGKVYKIEKKEEDYGDFSTGHIGLKDAEKEVAWVEYFRLNKPDVNNDYKFGGTKYQIHGIEVDENYRRKGLGTKLYKEIGKISGYNEIKLGSLSEEGKKLVNSIGTITRVENYLGQIIYYGKIKE